MLEEQGYMDIYKIYLKKQLGVAKLKHLNLIRSKSNPPDKLKDNIED